MVEHIEEHIEQHMCVRNIGHCLEEFLNVILEPECMLITDQCIIYFLDFQAEYVWSVRLP